jgi:hypothetical protein
MDNEQWTMINGKMVNSKWIAAFALIFALAACDDLLWNRGEPLAKVGGKTLYVSDIQEIFPKNISASDSIVMQRNYVDMWVKKELLLKLAEENLDSKRKNVTALLDEYRTSLLVYRYEQEYIEHRLDTVVTDAEIELFYNANKQNFMLGKPLVRVLFIKLKRNSPYLERIRSLYRTSNHDDISTLENLCLQAALRFDYFGDRWLSTEELITELPPVRNMEEQLLQKKYIEVSDNVYTYLVAVREYRERNSVAPLEYERSGIKTMILSRRKQYMIEDLEKRVLREAMNDKTVKIFLDE